MIRSIETILADVPTIRPHKLSVATMSTQTLVLVRVLCDDGIEGWGEATTIGGLSYGEESPESIKANIDTHIAPQIVGMDAAKVALVMARIRKAIQGNRFAKCAIETALLDAQAKRLGMPLSELLGGRVRDALPLAWTLASGDTARDIAEAEKMLAARRHRIFKLKIGARAPQDDVAHVARIARALDGRASMTVDVNQAWDGATARRYLPEMIDAGVGLIEQPVAQWNEEALRQLTATLPHTALVMADETVCTPQDAMRLARHNACHVFSLKIAKHGGLLRTRAVADVARAADIGWYGGTMLETSVGSAASAHVFATLGGTHHNCELFGPQLLVDDIVEQQMVLSDFALQLPDGPGFGLTVVPERLDRFDRARQGLTPVHVDLGRASAQPA